MTGTACQMHYVHNVAHFMLRSLKNYQNRIVENKNVAVVQLKTKKEITEIKNKKQKPQHRSFKNRRNMKMDCKN